MPTIVQRVSNAGAQGTRWRATPNAHRRKDQTVKISEKKEERTSPGWLIFTAVNWLSFIALQTGCSERRKCLINKRWSRKEPGGPTGLQNVFCRFWSSSEDGRRKSADFREPGL